MDRIVQLLINAAALYAAVFVVPGLDFDFGPPDAWWKFLLVAFIFSLVNTFLKPMEKSIAATRLSGGSRST